MVSAACCLFPFRKRSLLFLTVETRIGTQAFRHHGFSIYLGLNYNKANNTFLNSLRKNDVEARLNLRYGKG